MKTVSVALVLCLNVGVDPPDVVKTSPCARLECWIGEFLSVCVKHNLWNLPVKSPAGPFTGTFTGPSRDRDRPGVSCLGLGHGTQQRSSLADAHRHVHQHKHTCNLQLWEKTNIFRVELLKFSTG